MEGQGIRKVSNGVISTIAGNGTAGFSGDGGPAIDAEFYAPSGVAVDAAGNVYVADNSNDRIRILTPSCAFSVPSTWGRFAAFGQLRVAHSVRNRLREDDRRRKAIVCPTAIIVLMQIPVTVVILAAGLGTRMKSRRAKVLHRAGGKALVEHVVDTALQVAPAERIFVVVGHQAEEVRKAVATPGIGFIEQKEQKGTGHAVAMGRSQLANHDGYLLALYGDSPLLRAETLRRLIETEAAGDCGCVLLTAMMDDPTGYGRVFRDGDGAVAAIVEQKAGTPEQLAIREANMGIYCFRAELFWKHVGEMGTNNPAGEYYLTDMAEILTRAGHRVEAMRIDDPREALGINNRIELADADRLLRQAKTRELMLAGVTIEKPETVTIDAGATIGMDTVVGPFAQILGKTAIGENCRIGACAIVQDSELGDGVEIGPVHHREPVGGGARRIGGSVREVTDGQPRGRGRARRQLRRVEEGRTGRGG